MAAITRIKVRPPFSSPSTATFTYEEIESNLEQRAPGSFVLTEESGHDKSRISSWSVTRNSQTRRPQSGTVHAMDDFFIKTNDAMIKKENGEQTEAQGG